MRRETCPRTNVPSVIRLLALVVLTFPEDDASVEADSVWSSEVRRGKLVIVSIFSSLALT